MIKDERKVWGIYQYLPGGQKHKLLEYMKKYYLAHKSDYLVTLKILVQSNLFHGLVLEMLGKFEKKFMSLKILIP